MTLFIDLSWPWRVALAVLAVATVSVVFGGLLVLLEAIWPSRKDPHVDDAAVLALRTRVGASDQSGPDVSPMPRVSPHDLWMEPQPERRTWRRGPSDDVWMDERRRRLRALQAEAFRRYVRKG